MFRSNPETTKGQVCYELLTAANNSIHNEVSFTSTWTERVLTEKEDPTPK